VARRTAFQPSRPAPVCRRSPGSMPAAQSELALGIFPNGVANSDGERVLPSRRGHSGTSLDGDSVPAPPSKAGPRPHLLFGGPNPKTDLRDADPPIAPRAQRYPLPARRGPPFFRKRCRVARVLHRRTQKSLGENAIFRPDCV